MGKFIVKQKKYMIVIGLILLVTIGLITSFKSNADKDIQEIDQSDISLEEPEVIVEVVEEVKEEPTPTPTPEPTPEPTPTPTPEPIGPNSKLTGLPIHQEAYDQRPLGVMISNIKSALPQYGISDADIIYETLVEGGITRLFALYQDFDSEKIGPVRSSRHYYLDFALDHDAVYVHVGQSVYAIEAFKALDVDRFYGISYLDLILTFQDPNRRPPHSTFTSYDHLMATWDKLNYSREADYEETKFDFQEEDSELVDGQPLSKIILDYSYYVKPEFVYNEDDGLYYRYQFDTEHIDAANDMQLSFKNVIVQYTKMWKMPDDKDGCMDMTLITSGEGLYISNGQSIPITWTKTGHYSPTKYYNVDGSPLLINPGKTFVSVYPTYRLENIIME